MTKNGRVQRVFFKLCLVATNSTRRCLSTVSVKVKHGAPLDVMINHVVRQEDVVLRRRWAVLYACAMHARAQIYGPLSAGNT